MKKLIIRIMAFGCIFLAGYMYASGRRQIILSDNATQAPTEKVETVLARAQNPSFDFDEFLKLRWLNVTVEKDLGEIVVNAKQIDWSRPHFKINGEWDTTPESLFEEIKRLEECNIIEETEFDTYVKTYWANTQS